MIKSFIGKILKSFIEDEVREISIEVYEGYTQDSRQITLPGIDANPIPDDQGISITLDNSDGKTVCIGVMADPEIEPGEVKIKSRDSGGAEKGYILWKADGKIELNGNANSAVTFTPLDTALQTLVTAINTALGTKLDGGGSPGTLSLDISGAEEDTVLLP